jgi:protein tyrosine/serine phosphatase
MNSTRYLAWDACYNARDLGGLPTVDGGQTQWGSVIRSDILSRLTETGRQALLDYGVRTVIDLRSPQQVAEEPSAFPSATPAVNEPVYLNLPLEEYYPHVSALIHQAQTRAEVYCITLDHYPANVARVLRAIAQAAPGGVVIHCHAGKDRTGVIVALLLDLAGVPADQIAADYAESQARLWPLWEQSIAKVGGVENADFWLKPTATAEMMHTLLAYLRERYGDAVGYLRQAGLREDELTHLRHRLR